MRAVFLFLCVLLALAHPVQASEPTCDRDTGRGVASWYGPRFDGGLTKSGEVFDASGFTAAHATLPFGTLIKVVNTKNNRSVVVRINDRGGFGKSRVIDVSEAAAREIGIWRSGLAKVILYECVP